MSNASCSTPLAWETSVAEWQRALDLALEQQGDRLEEIPRIGDPGTSHGREKVLRVWEETTKAADEMEWENAAAQIAKCGLEDGRSFLDSGEKSLSVRVSITYLSNLSGVSALHQGDHSGASKLFTEGITQAQTLLACGLADPKAYKYGLHCLINAGVNLSQQGNFSGAEKLFEGVIGFLRELSSDYVFCNDLYSCALSLSYNSGVAAKLKGDNAEASVFYREGIAIVRPLLVNKTSSRVILDEISEGIVRLFERAAFNEVDQDNLAEAKKLFVEGIAYARTFLRNRGLASETRRWVIRLFYGAGLTFSGDLGDRTSSAQFYEEGSDIARRFIADGSSKPEFRDVTLRLLVNSAVEARALGRIDAIRLLEVVLAKWWYQDTASPDGSVLDQANLLFIGDLSKYQNDRDLVTFWPCFLDRFLLDWHGADYPHGNFGGALDSEGYELSPVQSAVAALESLVLWEHAQANLRTRAHYERLNRLRETVSETCAAWRQEQDRQRAELFTRRRRLHRLRAFCRRHRPLSAFLPVLLDKRIRRNCHGLLRPRAESLWNSYSDLRLGLTGWVLDGLSDTLGLAAGLAEEADVLLAAATLTTGGGNDGLAALLEQWLSGEPPWRDADLHATLLAPLADAWSEDGEALIDRWLERLGLDAVGLEVDQSLRFSPAPTLALALAAHAGGDLQPLCRMLDGAWRRACREAERLDRLHGTLALGEGIDALCPPLAARDANPATADDEVSPVEALLDDILAWQGLATGLANEADVLLGALFVLCLREQPEATAERVLRQWRDASPWEDSEDAEQTLHAMQRTWFARLSNSDNDWMELARLDSPTRQEPPPIRRWLEALHLTSDIEVDSALANAPAPTLVQVFASAQCGDTGPLHALLDAGWQRAQRTAKTLVRLREGIREGWINRPLADILEARSYRDACLSPPQRNLLYDITQSQERAALAAVLPGRARKFLRPAVETHLRQRAQQPAFLAALAACIRGRQRHYLQERIATTCDDRARIAPRQPLDRLGPAASRLYATAVHLHPGQAGDSALTSRLHQWARAALQEASAGDDLEGIWSALETGRIALSGLALSPPDRTWMTETADLLRKALAFSVNGDPDDPDWRRGWPPLTAWIRQCGRLRPASASLAACQARLRPGEALVQPFFVPDSGELQALWLSAGGELERRRFAAECDEAQWQERIFEPWSRWLDGVTRDPEARVWRKPGPHTLDEPPYTHREDWDTILGRPPVRRFAETLVCWVGEAGIVRLIMFLPAPLAQLPWESLPESPLPSGLLVRAVSLSHWRRAPRPDTDPAGWTFYDGDVDANGVRSLHFAGLEARRVDPAPYPNRARTSADVIAGLQGPATARAILHGLYRRFAPLRSGLAVHPGQFLPLWLPAAIGVKARLAVLSACESNLSGRATEGLLGPVGIGPAFVAAGAEAVLGTLWPCHDLATVAFADRLEDVANDDCWSTRPLQEKVTEAARRLRGMTGGEVRALIERLAGESGEDFAVYDDERWQPFYRGERPFAEPKFWASYVVLGELPPAAAKSRAET